MSSVLLATVSGLGTRNGEEYYRGEECLACVKDLIRSLRADDPQCTIRRRLGEAKTLVKDLIPILEGCADEDSVLKCDLIRLIVNLAQPAFLCFNNEYPVLFGKDKKDLDSVKSFIETETYLRCYKEAFAQPQIMNVLAVTLAHHCQKDWDDRDDDDTTMIERILLLIRNVLHVAPENVEEKRTLDDVTLHDQIIWNMHMNGLDELLIFLASNEDECHWCMHVLEIVFLMLREQMPDVLAKGGRAASKEERSRDDRILADLMKEEDLKRKQAAKLRGSRHSRFGGTYVSANTPSISNNPQVYHKPLARIGKYDYDAGKTAKRKPISRRPVPNQPRKRLSTYSIRLALKEFCVQFLECCYNPILRVVRDNIQHQKAMDNDDTYYLWAVRFFMNFSRHHDFRVEIVGETLSMQTIHYIIQLVGSRYENVMLEKNVALARQHSQRLQYAVQAYREILEYVETMSLSSDKSLVANANVILSNIFYHVEYRELFISLLRNFTAKKSGRDLLSDVVETLHLYLRMLEKYTKGRGQLLVQAKRKKAVRSTKKKMPAEQSETGAEGTEGEHDEIPQLLRVWTELEPSLQQALSESVDVEVESMDFHPSELQDDSARLQLVQKIREEMVVKQFTSAIATVRLARSELPGSVFGREASNPSDELEVLKSLFLDEQCGALNLDSHTQQDEVVSDQEEPEPVVESYEFDFDLNRFMYKLTAAKVIQNLCHLLSFHSSNSDHTNHCLAKVVYRIAFKLKLAPLFYQICYFMIFQEILTSPSLRYKELQKVASHLVSGFFQMCETNPMMYVELLFWRNPADCIDLEEGYGSLQMQRASKKNRNIWSREDDAELLELFEQHKDDEDIVSCILAALSNPNRSRQGVAAQLVKLGAVGDRKALQKKKKSTKVRWSPAEEAQLRLMYTENEQHLQEGGELDFESMAEVFEGKSGEDIKRRLIKLKLLSEKKKRGKRSQNVLHGEGGEDMEQQEQQDIESDFSDQSDDSDDSRGRNVPSSSGHLRKSRASGARVAQTGSSAAHLIRKLKSQKKRTTKSLNLASVVRFVWEAAKQGMVDALEWLKEYIYDEAKDRESEGVSADLCIVPIGEDLSSALRTRLFEELMSSLGLQPPDDTELYWRIPEHLNAEQLFEAASLLTPPPVGLEESHLSAPDSDDGDRLDNVAMDVTTDATLMNDDAITDHTTVSSAIVCDRETVDAVSEVVAASSESHNEDSNSLEMVGSTSENSNFENFGGQSDSCEELTSGNVVASTVKVPKKRVVAWSDDDSNDDDNVNDGGDGIDDNSATTTNHNTSRDGYDKPKAKRPNFASSDED